MFCKKKNQQSELFRGSSRIGIIFTCVQRLSGHNVKTTLIKTSVKVKHTEGVKSSSRFLKKNIVYDILHTVLGGRGCVCPKKGYYHK